MKNPEMTPEIANNYLIRLGTNWKGVLQEFQITDTNIAIYVDEQLKRVVSESVGLLNKTSLDVLAESVKNKTAPFLSQSNNYRLYMKLRQMLVECIFAIQIEGYKIVEQDVEPLNENINETLRTSSMVDYEKPEKVEKLDAQKEELEKKLIETSEQQKKQKQKQLKAYDEIFGKMVKDRDAY